MPRVSKFKIGQKVNLKLAKYSGFEIIEVEQNFLIVSPIEDRSLKFRYRKDLFEVKDNENIYYK